MSTNTSDTAPFFPMSGEATAERILACYAACDAAMLEALQAPDLPLPPTGHIHSDSAVIDKLQNVAISTAMSRGFGFGQPEIAQSQENTVQSLVKRFVDNFLAKDEAIEAIRKARAIRAGPER